MTVDNVELATDSFFKRSGYQIMKMQIHFAIALGVFLFFQNVNASVNLCDMDSTEWQGICTSDQGEIRNEIMYINYITDECDMIEIESGIDHSYRLDIFKLNGKTTTLTVDDELTRVITKTTDHWQNSDHTSFERLKSTAVQNLTTGLVKNILTEINLQINSDGIIKNISTTENANFTQEKCVYKYIGEI